MPMRATPTFASTRSRIAVTTRIRSYTSICSPRRSNRVRPCCHSRTPCCCSPASGRAVRAHAYSTPSANALSASPANR
ncbi:hypothetical protein GGD40_005695 [Paraburkholderia bryophila]|uniref:Uncharacterized protein n=1 Tax=Paraburkholderia bryophila TaxID=420952 RepID=A0A7Y9WS06_9BURK|nr:hypothetical protein [Paraburkholderia bryophila]